MYICTMAPSRCSKTQAAAVYCWTKSKEKTVDARIDKIDVKENRKFGIYFKMSNLVGITICWMVISQPHQSHPTSPLPSVVTGILVKRYKYESEASKGQMLIIGKMADGCEECVELHYLTATFFASHICGGELAFGREPIKETSQ